MMNIQSLLDQGPRHDWTCDEARALLGLPFNDLVFVAQTLHRRHFDPNEVQLSTLLSVKTGACPEDCAYCPQSIRYRTGVEAEKLMDTEAVLASARECQLLNIEPGEPCLLIRRRTWSGRLLVANTRLLYPGTRYRLERKFAS